MALPADFDRSMWLDPLTFEGLIGAVLASNKVQYRELFRVDGFAKPEAELRGNPYIAKLLEKL